MIDKEAVGIIDYLINQEVKIIKIKDILEDTTLLKIKRTKKGFKADSDREIITHNSVFRINKGEIISREIVMSAIWSYMADYSRFIDCQHSNGKYIASITFETVEFIHRNSK